MSLPNLVVNRHFMSKFVAAQPPCFGLALVEVGDIRCPLLALRPEEALPRSVTADGFRFGHALLGTDTWKVVHFAFEFRGSGTYNVLVNPSDPVARSVLDAMVQTGDYFVFALDSDHSTTAFRSSMATDTLAGLKANMDRIRASTTTAAQYRLAVSHFAKHPEPPGTLLSWVCRGNIDYLDLQHDRLVINPA